MSRNVSDTSSEAERVQIEILRAMPPWRKFQLLNDLIITGRKLALAGLHERFPDASAEELRRRLATILLGPELAAKAYGPEPDPSTMSAVPPDFYKEITRTVDTVVVKQKLEDFGRQIGLI